MSILLGLQNAASHSAYAGASEVFQWLEMVQSAIESVILSLPHNEREILYG